MAIRTPGQKMLMPNVYNAFPGSFLRWAEHGLPAVSNPGSALVFYMQALVQYSLGQISSYDDNPHDFILRGFDENDTFHFGLFDAGRDKLAAVLRRGRPFHSWTS